MEMQLDLLTEIANETDQVKFGLIKLQKKCRLVLWDDSTG